MAYYLKTDLDQSNMSKPMRSVWLFPATTIFAHHLPTDRSILHKFPTKQILGVSPCPHSNTSKYQGLLTAIDGGSFPWWQIWSRCRPNSRPVDCSWCDLWRRGPWTNSSLNARRRERFTNDALTGAVVSPFNRCISRKLCRALVYCMTIIRRCHPRSRLFDPSVRSSACLSHLWTLS